MACEEIIGHFHHCDKTCSLIVHLYNPITADLGSDKREERFIISSFSELISCLSELWISTFHSPPL